MQDLTLASRACFGESPVGHATMPITALSQTTEEGVKHDLLCLASHRQKGADEAGQWQLSTARASVGDLKMPRIGGKLRRDDSLRELGE